MTSVRADSIPQGGFFRKRGGTFVYLRISHGAAERFISPLYIFGVNYHGNITQVNLDERVYPATLYDFARNIEADAKWHGQIGNTIGITCAACHGPEDRAENVCAKCWKARYTDERRKQNWLRTQMGNLRRLLKAHVPGLNDFDIQEALERDEDG